MTEKGCQGSFANCVGTYKVWKIQYIKLWPVLMKKKEKKRKKILKLIAR
jgi:hypothetical protein